MPTQSTSPAMPITRTLSGVIVICVVAVLAACSGPSRKHAVPFELADKATVMNNPALRSWDNALNPAFMDEIIRAVKRELEQRAKAGEHGPLPTAHLLAISGGGADGAYGAGILCGWTAAGTRPEFKIVTGISTGALTAPFAFLGSAYDDKLRTVYCTINAEKIARQRPYAAAFFDDAMLDTTPLRRLLTTLLDDQMMRAIATEYGRGRLLLVQTTNMDSNRGVIWNITAIAASGEPGSLTLIHDILMASSAIPGAFPPVMLNVTAEGKVYQEMHVDGGTKAQVFLYPPSMALKDEAAEEGLSRHRIAYIIRNSRLDPRWEETQRRTLSIAVRAISSLIATQGVGDLFRLYLTMQRDGIDFNLAYIPATFNAPREGEFDPVYMTQLFNVGFNAAIASGGYPWEKMPPGYVNLSRPAPAAPTHP